MNESEASFFKVGDRVFYNAPDQDENEDRIGKVTAILRPDSIVVEWDDGQISTVSENHLDLA